jgi:amino acid transporter
VLACATVVAVICLLMMPVGFLDAFSMAGTFASFGFVVVYLALCIVAPLDLKKTGEMKHMHWVLGLVGAALMLFVIKGSVYPVPEHPFDILPYLFFAYMVLGAVWFGILKFKSPETLASIQHDMEG